MVPVGLFTFAYFMHFLAWNVFSMNLNASGGLKICCIIQVFTYIIPNVYAIAAYLCHSFCLHSLVRLQNYQWCCTKHRCGPLASTLRSRPYFHQNTNASPAPPISLPLFLYHDVIRAAEGMKKYKMDGQNALQGQENTCHRAVIYSKWRGLSQGLSG